jgi:hypothetical protein
MHFSARDLWWSSGYEDQCRTWDAVDEAEVDFDAALDRLADAAERLNQAVAKAEEDGYGGDACEKAARATFVVIIEELLTTKQVHELCRRTLPSAS